LFPELFGKSGPIKRRALNAPAAPTVRSVPARRVLYKIKGFLNGESFIFRLKNVDYKIKKLTENKNNLFLTQKINGLLLK